MILLDQVIKLELNVGNRVSAEGSVNTPNSLVGDIAIGGVSEYYTGDYTVIPKAFNDQVLNTQNKMMSENVTVTKIRTAQTPNAFGDTFFIAE